MSETVYRAGKRYKKILNSFIFKISAFLFQGHFECPTCGRTFTRNERLKHHIMGVHQGWDSTLSLLISNGKFICPYVDYRVTHLVGYNLQLI